MLCGMCPKIVDLQGSHGRTAVAIAVLDNGSVLALCQEHRDAIVRVGSNHGQMMEVFWWPLFRG